MLFLAQLNLFIQLKELSPDILSYFGHVQNNPSTEGKLKIIIYQDGKTPEIIINHESVS